MNTSPTAEKDVEQEIKNTKVESTEVAAELEKKEFHEDFFDTPPGAREAKALGKETGGGALQDLMHQPNPLLAQLSQYPFLNALALRR